MNSSKQNENKTKTLTAEEQRQEAMAIFVAGQVMGLMSQLNNVALEKFLKSERSDPKQGSDFRYRRQIAVTVKFHKELFKDRGR